MVTRDPQGLLQPLAKNALSRPARESLAGHPFVPVLVGSRYSGRGGVALGSNASPAGAPGHGSGSALGLRENSLDKHSPYAKGADIVS